MLISLRHRETVWRRSGYWLTNKETGYRPIMPLFFVRQGATGGGRCTGKHVVEAIARNFPTGTRVTRPGGSFVAWVDLPSTVDALPLHRQALEKGVSIAPGSLFSATEKYRNFVRIICALPWDDRLDRALSP